MKFFRKKSARPANVAKVPTMRQPATLGACITQFMAANPERMVKVKHAIQGKGFGGYIDPVAVKELHQNQQAIAPFLRDLAGGGKYTLEFYDDADTMYASYTLPIEGATKKDRTDSDEAKARSSSASGFEKQFETMMTMMGTMMTALITKGEGGGANALEMLGAVQKLKGGDSEILKEMLVNTQNNFLTALSSKEGGGSISDFMSGFEMAKGLTTVEPESATTALISAAAPAIASGLSALIASKMGGGGNGKVAQPRPLQHGARSPNIAAIPQTAAPVAVPGPGEPHHQRSEPPLPRQQIERQPSNEPTEASRETEQPVIARSPAAPVSVLEPMIAKLRAAAGRREDAEIVARQVMTLIDTAEVFAPDNPPDLLKGIIGERDLSILLPAIERFFEEIPEFKADAEYTLMVKAQLQAQAMEMYAEAGRYVANPALFDPEQQQESEVLVNETDQNPGAGSEDDQNAIPEIEPGPDSQTDEPLAEVGEPVKVGKDGP